MVALSLLASDDSRKLLGMIDFFTLVLASFFIGLFSQISIYLWFTPVPFTLQTVAVLLVAGILGSKRGTLSLIFYLIEGGIGLPVFVNGSSGLSGLTVGYLIGFVLATFVMGYLFERGASKNYFKTVLTLLVGSLIILLTGTIYLSLFFGFKKALYYGFYPFVLSDVAKTFFVASFLPISHKVFNRYSHFYKF